MTNLRDLLKHHILSEISQTKVPFLGFDDSEWFNNETYYLLEIDRDGDTKVIDSSIIKERLEAKAERYNELFKKDKDFYWNIVRKIYNDWQKDIHQIYFSLKTLEDFNNAYIKFTNKHLELIDKQILPKFLEFVSLENGYFQLKTFSELSYKVKTTEKGFYEKNSE
jgi:hypothetical protein